MTDKRIKKIGLVGGTGPESTLMYYKELNSRIDKLTDGITSLWMYRSRHEPWYKMTGI